MRALEGESAAGEAKALRARRRASEVFARRREAALNVEASEGE